MQIVFRFLGGLHVHMFALCFLSFKPFAYREKAWRLESMNVTARVRVIMLKNEASHLNVKYRGLAKDLVSELGQRGAVGEGKRFSRKGQACELSASHSIQPPELRAFILGNNVGFIICKNGAGKTGLSCSESRTGRDHLSALIESPGCRAGGSVQPSGSDKHTHTYLNCSGLTAVSLKEGAPRERAMWDSSQDWVRDGVKCLFTAIFVNTVISLSVPGLVLHSTLLSTWCWLYCEACLNCQEAWL